MERGSRRAIGGVSLGSERGLPAPQGNGRDGDVEEAWIGVNMLKTKAVEVSRIYWIYE